MVWADIAIAAASVIGTAAGLYESGQQGKYANHALSIADDQRNKQDTSFNQLQDLLKDPSSFFSSPVYLSAFDQGTKAVGRGNAAAGYLGSGNMSTALQQYGQSFGQSQLFQQEELLAGMSGTGFNPSGAVGVASGAGQNAFNDLGQVLASLGYATGKGGTGWGGSGAGGGGGTPNVIEGGSDAIG